MSGSTSRTLELPFRLSVEGESAGHLPRALRSKDVDSEVAAGLQATGLGEDEEEGAGLRLNANPKVRCPGSSGFGFEPPFGRPGPRFSADGSDDLGGIARERRAVEVVRMATASRRRDKYMIKLRII